MADVPESWIDRTTDAVMEVMQWFADALWEQIRALLDLVARRLPVQWDTVSPPTVEDFTARIIAVVEPEAAAAFDAGAALVTVSETVRGTEAERRVEYLTQVRSRLSRGRWPVNTWDVIRGTLVDAIDGGWTLEEATDEVLALLSPDTNRHAAERIVVTELHAAYNAGTYYQAWAEARQTGAPFELEWIATADERTRVWHWEADRQRVQAGTPFQVGGEALRFPGDPLGSASNVIRCRCGLGVWHGLAAAASLTAAGAATLALPFADRDASWDGRAAEAAALACATRESGSVDPAVLGRIYLYRLPGTDGTAQAHYRFPVARPRPGGCAVELVWSGITAAAGRLSQAEIGVDGRRQVARALAGLYRRAGDVFDDDTISPPESVTSLTAGWPVRGAGTGDGDERAEHFMNTKPDTSSQILESAEPPASAVCRCEAAGMSEATAGHIAALQRMTASAVPAQWTPPAAWFAPYDGPPTGIRITPEGRVLGYLATWERDDAANCHIGIKGGCEPPPRSPDGLYRYFHQDGTPLTLDDGEQIHPGLLTMDIGHGDQSQSQAVRIAHYDDPRSMAAAVVVGEDETGIWVAGSVLPEVAADRDRMVRLQRSRFSGHWEPIGGGMELIAATAVNAPGFPNPSASGYRLTASAIADEVLSRLDGQDRARRARVLAGSVNRTRRARAAVMAAAVSQVRRARARALAATVGPLAAAENWVSQQGGLPEHIAEVARALKREGMDESRAIATAVNRVREWCRGGDDVTTATQTRACAAIAEWERMRAQSGAVGEGE